MNLMRSIVGVACAVMVYGGVLAQDKEPADIHKYVARVAAGESTQVRKELPALLAAYPDDPGVRYLQALLSTDGTEAARIYESILETAPRSEWADDALYRLAKFYESVGFTRTAELRMERLRREYPNSQYVTGVPEVSSAGPAATAQRNVVDSSASPAMAAAKPRPATPGRDQAVATPNPPMPVAKPLTRPLVPEHKPPAAQAGGFAIQVGAFSLAENAEKVKGELERAGYTVEVTREDRDGKTLHVVKAGNYATEDKARAECETMKQQLHLNGIVVAR